MVARRISANVAFFLALLFFIGLALGGTVFTLHRLGHEAIRTHLEISATYAHVFEDHLTQTLQFVDLILTQSVDAQELQQEPKQVSLLLARIVRQTPAVRSLSLLDAQGHIVASSNSANIGVAPGEMDCLPPPGQGDYFGIGKLWSGRDFARGRMKSDGQALQDHELPGFIPVLRELRVGTAKIRLLAAINPDYLINNFSQKLTAEKGFVEVLRYDGVRLISTNESAVSGRDAGGAFLKYLSDKETGSFQEVLPNQTEVFTSYRASSQFPLVILAHLDREHALKKWNEERRLLLLIVVPTLLVVVLLATLLYRRQRRIAIEYAEERQREHERLAATVFATVDEAVMVTDANNHIIEVNPAFTLVTGFAPEDVVGKAPEMLSSNRHGREFFEKISSSLAQEGAWQGEMWSRHKNGKEYIEWLSIKQVRNQKGELIHNVAAFSDITDRKQAQETQLHAVLEASPEAVVMVGEDGTICYANRVSERVFGYSPRELKGLSIETLVPPEFRHSHENYRAHFAETPRSRPMASGMKLSVLCKDGTTFPAEISLSPINMGEDHFIIAAVSDISQRIRDEETLRASEQRWKFALEGAGEGVWDWNMETDQTLFSPRILDFWGYPDGDGDSRMEDWTDRIHPDDKARFMAELQAHLAGGSAAFAIEHRVRSCDGAWKWALARGMVVSQQADGRPQRMIGTYADISERKKIEADFQDLLQFNQSVIANSFSGIMVHQYNGECVMANEAAARISGGSVEQLLHHNFRRSQSWRESGACAAAEKALETGMSIDFESPMNTFFGRVIWCVASFRRLSFKGESFLLSVFNDLSTRKDAENALRQAKENAEALLDRARLAERRIIDISEETRKNIGQELHDDLGQHLTGVAFLSEVLFQKLKGQGSAEMQEASNITRLINDAVAKTRLLAQGLYPVELKETGLRALLAQTARNVENIYRIPCTFSADDDIAIDDFQTEINLFRIAQEAINNAIRHGSASQIRLELLQQENVLHFSIADNGEGFEIGPGSAKTSGLGMHTMDYRAALIGASLDIQSTPGHGTTVSITLPMPQGLD